MNENKMCPFCGLPATEQYVVQRKFRGQKWKQYFHTTCYLKNTKGGNYVIPKQSESGVNQSIQ